MDSPRKNEGKRLLEHWPQWSGIVLFIAYPLALLPATAGAPFAFHISIPVFLWVAMGSYVALLFNPPGPRKAMPRFGQRADSPYLRNGHHYIYAGAIALGLWFTLSAVVGGTAEAGSTVAVIGMFSVPLFFAMAPRKWLPTTIVPLLAWLWLLHVLYAGCQIIAGFSPVGLAGNRNWSATLAAALTPWVILQLRSLSRKKKAASGSKTRILSLRNALIVISCIISIAILWVSHCRATWMLLALYTLYGFGTWRRNIWIRLAPAIVLLIGAVALLLARPGILAKIQAQDIRFPLYTQSLKMALAHPLVGVGPGNFRREFVEYRSDEHKKKLVAAHVTEHPHNEILHLAASVGLPAALVWSAFCICLLLPLRRPSLFWYSIHLSAWLIVGHGMLDKTLVQPPTNIIGLACLGLLWRQWCPWRLSAKARVPGLERVCPIMTCVVCLYLLVASFQVAVTGYCFRAARIAEQAGRNEDAYRHYRVSAQLNTADVRTHAYAGICANNRLRNPRLALEHLLYARDLEKDFAHLNGEIGLALGALGQHREAFPFFDRECSLYPYDLLAHERLYQCSVATSRIDLLTPLNQKLAELRVREATKKLSAPILNNVCRIFADALARNENERSLAAANTIAVALRETGVDPGLDSTPPPGASFVATDMDFWRKRHLNQRQALGNGDRTDIRTIAIEAFGNNAHDGTQDAMEKASHLATALGWQMARAVGLDPGLPDVIIVADNTGKVHVFPSSGDPVTGNNAREALSAIETAAGKRPRTAAEQQQCWAFRIPAEKEAYLWRHQALSHILGTLLGPDTPLVIQSPLLRRTFWLQHLERDYPEEELRPSVTPETL